jgi:hypothetical protein
MAKEHKMDLAKIELDKLLVQYVVSKDETLLAKISELKAKLDYFNYGIKQNYK